MGETQQQTYLFSLSSPLHLKTCYTISVTNGAAEARERERVTNTKLACDTEKTRSLGLIGSEAYSDQGQANNGMLLHDPARRHSPLFYPLDAKNSAILDL